MESKETEMTEKRTVLSMPRFRGLDCRIRSENSFEEERVLEKRKGKERSSSRI